MKYIIISVGEYLKYLNGKNYFVVDSEGNVAFMKNGVYHNDGKDPAIIGNNLSYIGWFKNGKLYRGGKKPSWIAREKGKVYSYFIENDIIKSTHCSEYYSEKLFKRLITLFKIKGIPFYKNIKVIENKDSSIYEKSGL